VPEDSVKGRLTQNVDPFPTLTGREEKNESYKGSWRTGEAGGKRRHRQGGNEEVTHFKGGVLCAGLRGGGRKPAGKLQVWKEV